MRRGLGVAVVMLMGALVIAGCGRRRTVVAAAPPPSSGAVVVTGPAPVASGSVVVSGGGGGYAGGGAYVPTQCGMSYAEYGPLGVGGIVVLGRHSPWTGPDGQGGYSRADDNWAGEMMVYVGQQAVVTSVEGLDSAGCPVVHVNIDGGQFFWRIRDMQVVSAGGGGYAGGGYGGAYVPTQCGMSMAAYGPIQVGSQVILGQHSPYTGPDGQGGYARGDDNWAGEMGRWVGQRAVVTQLAGLDSAGCPGVRVTSDGGQYFWRIRDMRF